MCDQKESSSSPALPTQHSNNNHHCGLNHNPWSQYVIYGKILNNGCATQPTTWTNTRGAENSKQPHRKIIYLMAILLLAGDVQVNPRPRLASASDLLPSLGALNFRPALAVPPLMYGGAHGGHLLQRGDSSGEWSALMRGALSLLWILQRPQLLGIRLGCSVENPPIHEHLVEVSSKL